MALSKPVWGIDIGQCALKAIKLRYDAKLDKATAEAFDYVEHPKILSQPDADADDLIASALKTFLDRNEVADSEIFISVPGQAGLARFVKLPPVEQKKIPDIVRFEAKQQIPFPLEDVAWDYQKIGAGEEMEGGLALETEVGIFAIKRDVVGRHLRPFEQASLEVSFVQLAPVALYNFAAYDYIYHTRKAAEAKKPAPDGAEGAPEDVEADEEGSAIVILDMGADKTDVVVTDGDSIWLRNLPIGGNHFTRALTKELKLTFAKAEHLKRNATKAPDPKKLYQAMRQVFQDFASELQRSIGYYSSTHRGQQVKRIVAVGNGFRLPGLQKYLQQNLEYEVVRYTEFKGLSGEEVLGAPAFADNLLSFAVPYGLALQGLGQTPIQTNLLPRDVQVKRMVRAKKAWSLASATVVLLGCLFLFYGNWRVFSAVNAETFKGPEAEAKSAVASFTKHDADFKAALATLETEKKNGSLLVGSELAPRRIGWLHVLKVINSALPERKPDADDSKLESVDEVNIEFVIAEYVTDTASWFNKFDQPIKNTMHASERAAMPSGPAWLFRVLGYTFHGEGQQYIETNFVRRFQTDAMRKEGITHAVAAQVHVYEEWTPSTPSELMKWAGSRAAPAGAAAQGPGQPKSMSGGMNFQLPASAQKMAFQQQTLPADVRQYRDQSTARSSEGAGFGRTDFEIQFLWKPPEGTPGVAPPPP